MATWPTTLPAQVKTGYSLKPVDQTIRTEMEVGPRKTRRVSTARNDSITLSWFMSDAQFLAFRAWFDDGETGIAGGAGWFTGLPLDVGSGIQTTLECRFTGIYEAALVPGAQAWKVSGNIEVR